MGIKIKIGILFLFLGLILINGCGEQIGSEKKALLINITSEELNLDFKCEYESYNQQQGCFNFIRNLDVENEN